jgi:glyoxylase-like metal-dependent hydrolase (beta-lactamase superfamily II)/prolyl-tRNA editing enzyme YbaK/EbsC (Cys-tRNA(Pro) deacylase)
MPKFSLKNISGNSYIIEGSAFSIGVYVNEDNIAILFDSGIDKDVAKAVEKALAEGNITIGAIVNTHHHVDHVGGNQFLQNRLPNLTIYASAWEKHFIEEPSLETTCFNCGAEPHSGINGHRHLQALPSKVTNTLEYKDSTCEILGAAFRIVPLPGHTQGMIGIVTPDNVLYCGDAFFGPDTFGKHRVPLYTSIGDALKSFEKLATLDFAQCVLYHGGLLTRDVALHMVELHRERLVETADTIHAIIHNNTGFGLDALTQAVMQKFSIPNDMVQLHLTRATVNAYITYLEQLKRIKLSVENGSLTYTSIMDLDAKPSAAKPESESDALSKSASRVQDALEKKGFNLKVIELSETTHRASDAAFALKCDVAQIVKSLLFKTEKTSIPVLVLASGSNQVNEKVIKQCLGLDEKVVKADADFTRQITGFAIGGIPPVGHTTPIANVFIDEDLLKHTEVWAAAGTPHAVFSLPSAELKNLTNGRVISVTEFKKLATVTQFDNARRASVVATATATAVEANDPEHKKSMVNTLP